MNISDVLSRHPLPWTLAETRISPYGFVVNDANGYPVMLLRGAGRGCGKTSKLALEFMLETVNQRKETQ